MLKNSNTDVDNSIDSSIKWKALPDSAAVKRWAFEMREIAQKPFNVERWQLLGHGVILESDDRQEISEIAPMIANVSGFQAVTISRFEMLEDEVNIFDVEIYKKPTLIFLESGPWISHKDVDSDDALPEHANFDADKALSFRLKLRKFLLEEVPQLPVIFVTGVRTPRSVDPILRICGCFDRKIAIPELKAPAFAKVFIEEMGEEMLSQDLINDQPRLGALLASQYYNSGKLKLMQLALRRLARGGKKIEFQDILLFALYGTTEMDEEVLPTPQRTRDAVHEVGHALMWILNSKGTTYPYYCSVISRDRNLGITAPNYQSRHESAGDRSFQEHINHMKMQLGGRVAEHMVYGIPNVSAQGSGSDLEGVSKTTWQLFAKHGLPSDMSSDENAASNILVVAGDPSPSESERYERVAREFVANLYQQVLGILNKNRVIFDALVDALVEQTFLDQHGMRGVVEATCMHKGIEIEY